MNRPRKHDRHLPRNVYLRHGAYYHVKAGKWTRIGSTLREALSTYAAIYEAPAGTMAALIAQALPIILASVKPSTAKQYRTAARKLSVAMVEYQPTEVSHKVVTELRNGWHKTPNMANRCLSVLRLVFDYALDQQLVSTNPVIGLKRHAEAKRTRLLLPAELNAIYAQSGERLQIIIDLCLRTGQRIKDVLGIRRADLTDTGIRFKQQKTDAKLTVPWTPELKAVTDRAKSLGGISALTLLHNRRGKAPDYSTVRDQWRAACAAAGVADANLHDLRAVAATWAKQQGKNATALLGHSSAAQTVRYLRDREEPVAEGPSFGQVLDTKR